MHCPAKMKGEMRKPDLSISAHQWLYLLLHLFQRYGVQNMSAILLKNFPEKLHTEARHRALDEGITLKELFIKAVYPLPTPQNPP